MRAAMRRFEEMLGAIGLGRAISPIGEALRGGKALRQSQRMREFYAALLPKGALVFDIGANVGTMSRIFAGLGARVVAVEPNPDCARHIELSTRRGQVEVLAAAVSDRDGQAVLKVSDRKDKMSSLSDDWRDAVSKENADYVGMWKREVTVPTITLDALIQRYGEPWYIKIDVEGYEEQVIKGLSQCPSLLSFEFNRVFLEPALKALESGVFDDAVFNYTLIDPVRFELADWVERNELKKAILELGEGQGLGDVFVRRRA